MNCSFPLGPRYLAMAGSCYPLYSGLFSFSYEFLYFGDIFGIISFHNCGCKEAVRAEICMHLHASYS